MIGLQRCVAVVMTLGLAGGVLAANNQLCFYVDKGVPGHCFVQFLPKQGPQAGAANLVYGKYPGAVNIFGGAGKIKDDSKRAWDQRICYPVTVAQYNAAAAKVRGKIAAPPPYNLVKNPPGNCVNWMSDTAGAAGIGLPNKIRWFGIATPGEFGRSLKAIGNGGVFAGGTVQYNANPGQSADGSPIALNPPHDWDAQETALASHADPVGQSLAMQLALDQQNMGIVNLTAGGELFVLVNGTNPDDALITLDWGEGSDLDGQALSFTHVFADNGTYDVSLTVIDGGTLHSFEWSVDVSDGSFKEVVVIDVPPSEPSKLPNPGFDDLVPLEYICPWDLNYDGVVGINDFLALLAAWGSSPLGPPDFDDDGIVGIIDFLDLLAYWGPCP